MTPQAAVQKLAETVAQREAFTEDEVYAALAAAGVPERAADRAYKFTLFAWGRAFLAGLGIRFSPDYFCFDAHGTVVETGRLEEEPYFAAARGLVQKYERTPGFERLALMSSDVQAVNAALEAGSRPENLVTSPAAMFLAAPTPAGMENARRALAEHEATRPEGNAGAAQAVSSPGKPWWRFWR